MKSTKLAPRAPKPRYALFLFVSTVSYAVFNTLTLAQQFGDLPTERWYVIIPSMLSAITGLWTLLFGIYHAISEFWHTSRLTSALIWAAAIVVVNMVVTNYSPEANLIPFN